MSDENKRLHLRDLFRTGKEVKFDVETDQGSQEIVLWMRKPTAGQQDEALNKARGQQARRRNLYKDKESDHYMAYWADVEDIEHKDELVEQIFKFEKQKLKQQAFNDVLYNEEYIPRNEDGEPKWGENNQQYLDLLMAIQNRMEEVVNFNEELEEEDKNLWIKFEEDEELQRLEEERESFEQAVDERYEALRAEFVNVEKLKTMEDLKKLLMKKLVDSDTSLAWYEEYRKWMLFFASRDPEDRTKSYFSHPDEVLELPAMVLQILEDQLNDLDRGADAIKNSRSLQLSSNSSE